MIPKRIRLTSVQVQSGSLWRNHKVPDAGYGLKYRKNNLGYSRYAIVVGKKIAARAVDRNRIRRTIYDALGGMSNNPVDIVIFITKPTWSVDNLKQRVGAIRL